MRELHLRFLLKVICAISITIPIVIFYSLNQKRGLSSDTLNCPKNKYGTRSNAVNISYGIDPSVVFWSNDYHISPIQDLKHLLQPLGVEFIDKSLSGHCHVTNTCSGRATLKIINTENGMDLNPSLIPEFYRAYQNSSEMSGVSAFVCFHPTSMCELFEPFNKSLIIIASTRYELGRFDADRWKAWNSNLKRYATDPKNVIGANNLYDSEYIKYFTGIEAEVLPSFCDYIEVRYNPTRHGYLLAPVHNKRFEGLFLKQYAEACPNVSCNGSLSRLRSIYPQYNYSDLTAHMGIVYVPYQVSVMSFFEQYRMNIPIFCPSLDLLAQWQYDHMVMNERTWDGVFGRRPNGSKIEPDPSQIGRPDPNNERNVSAIRYWLKYADCYQFPHVIIYHSVSDLASRLQTLTVDQLRNVSSAMENFNFSAKKELLGKWGSILNKVVRYRAANSGKSAASNA